ncbi:MAG TPA: RNA polymerase sigma factor [Vicinamibacterales bacterium]|nr:RNA polymerase sigma factor [Vicinamibacterales bacterium]
MNEAVSGHRDLALAERCRNGVAGAFEELYQAHAPRLFGLACRMVGRTDAEDLLQDIFLTAHRKLGLYKGESSLGTWLFRLATNQCLDFLRSRGARFAQVTDTLEEEPPAAASAGTMRSAVDRLDLERALTTLPPGCRTVFVLHDVEGLEHREIGDLLGISEGTSKSQLHKARMRLRGVLTGRTVVRGSEG